MYKWKGDNLVYVVAAHKTCAVMLIKKQFIQKQSKNKDRD